MEWSSLASSKVGKFLIRTLGKVGLRPCVCKRIVRGLVRKVSKQSEKIS